MLFSSPLLRFSAFASLISASPLPAEKIERRALLPAFDSFYKPPSGWESAAPGTVFKSRKIAIFFPLAPLGTEAWQLLYRTNGAEDNTPLTTVTTVFKPPKADASKLVVFNTAEDAASINCSPSYVYQLGSIPTDGIVFAEVIFISALLQMGYFVASADHEGPNSSFGAGRLAGHAVLDGTRAVKNFASSIGLNADVKMGLMGYSGGAIATGWALALQPTYATDLTFVGGVIGGTPANISGTFKFIDGGLFAGFGFAGVQGLSTAYPKVSTLISSKATFLGKAALKLVSNICAFTALAAFAFQRVAADAFSSLGAEILEDAELVTILQANVLGAYKNETPSIPTYVYHSKYDEVIPIKDADFMVNSWCSNGISSLEYNVDIGPSEHASELLIGFPYAVTWLKARLEGDNSNLAQGCKRTETILTVPATDILGSSAQPAMIASQVQLNTVFGRDDSILKAAIGKKKI